MQWEDSFYALIVDDSPDGESFVNPAAFPCDYRAGKNLYTFFVAFFYAAADIYSVAYFEVRCLLL